MSKASNISLALGFAILLEDLDTLQQQATQCRSDECDEHIRVSAVPAYT